MDVRIMKLSNKHFVSNISISELISSVEKVYEKDMKLIENEYSSEMLSEEYCEYIISSATNDNVFVDNIVLFTKEKYNHNYENIKINSFVVADGITKLIIINKLLIAKEFILKRVDSDNIKVFRDLYKNLFSKETSIPSYYFDAVLATLTIKYKGDIRKFNLEFLKNKMPVTIVSSTDEDYIREYIMNKNLTNKLITYSELQKKINFKLKPYNS